MSALTFAQSVKQVHQQPSTYPYPLNSCLLAGLCFPAFCRVLPRFLPRGEILVVRCVSAKKTTARCRPGQSATRSTRAASRPSCVRSGRGFLAFGRLARPRVWSCTNAQSCAIAQWLKGAAAPTLRTQTKSVHEFYCSGKGQRGSALRPVHLLRVFLRRVLEANFPGDSLYNYMDMIVPTLEN